MLNFINELTVHFFFSTWIQCFHIVPLTGYKRMKGMYQAIQMLLKY